MKVKNRLILKSLLIGIIIGGIGFGGMGVIATTLSANKITYTSKHSDFSVTNAQDPVDELYKIAKQIQETPATISIPTMFLYYTTEKNVNTMDFKPYVSINVEAYSTLTFDTFSIQQATYGRGGIYDENNNTLFYSETHVTTKTTIDISNVKTITFKDQSPNTSPAAGRNHGGCIFSGIKIS